MVLNDNDSSWTAHRLQDAIGIVEMKLSEAIDRISNEYTRPSVLFKPTLKPLNDGKGNYEVTYPGFNKFVYGSTPDDAMRAFDRAWKGEE